VQIVHDILKIKNLNKKFGGVIATKNLNLSILDAELHAIIGPNGAGKTTLVSQIFGQIFPDSGQIFFSRYQCYARFRIQKISAWDKSDLSNYIGYEITDSF
jgi:ABC-type branched-subunit amino acid transport system ATPase component